MDITDIRIYPIETGRPGGRLKAYAAITFDDAFVVRSLRILEGPRGLFVAMPSQRGQSPCERCGYHNAARSRFCNQCGGALNPSDRPMDHGGEGQEDPAGEHWDIAHPITPELRAEIQKQVLAAYAAHQNQ
ncbi:MAG: hypothetical protein COV76_03825 [Candidatus Omnitrophica bacterium CG11_big_fil_rev_8_21_14_0_20_64_10]|nr:MAG: hypothetical protein COV76_03825 [Candidatus Omnitrophica bacterium CG11_big_fil_rev_8_21_14_0_20_64_10]